jgi:rubrerythrin
MKSVISILFVFCIATICQAFSPLSSQRVTATAVRNSQTSLGMVFGKKKTAAQKQLEEEEAAKYWQGEWVCKDCGYIYNRVSTEE